eukprot:3939968-Rhodomonas_salina.1
MVTVVDTPSAAEVVPKMVAEAGLAAAVGGAKCDGPRDNASERRRWHFDNGLNRRRLALLERGAHLRNRRRESVDRDRHILRLLHVQARPAPALASDGDDLSAEGAAVHRRQVRRRQLKLHTEGQHFLAVALGVNGRHGTTHGPSRVLRGQHSGPYQHAILVLQTRCRCVTASEGHGSRQGARVRSARGGVFAHRRREVAEEERDLLRRSIEQRDRSRLHLYDGRARCVIEEADGHGRRACSKLEADR